MAGQRERPIPESWDRRDRQNPVDRQSRRQLLTGRSFRAQRSYPKVQLPHPRRPTRLGQQPPGALAAGGGSPGSSLATATYSQLPASSGAGEETNSVRRRRQASKRRPSVARNVVLASSPERSALRASETVSASAAAADSTSRSPDRSGGASREMKSRKQRSLSVSPRSSGGGRDRPAPPARAACAPVRQRSVVAKSQGPRWKGCVFSGATRPRWPCGRGAITVCAETKWESFSKSASPWAGVRLRMTRASRPGTSRRPSRRGARGSARAGRWRRETARGRRRRDPGAAAEEAAHHRPV